MSLNEDLDSISNQSAVILSFKKEANLETDFSFSKSVITQCSGQRLPILLLTSVAEFLNR